MNQITGRTRLVSLVGWPVEHSLSPAMHNAAFEALRLNWCYVPLAVYPEQVETAINGLAALGFAGTNVTVPHKQAVVRYMDELDSVALATGAVNTIHIRDGKFLGYNTDVIGFLNSLKEANCYPTGMRAVVLGAGGAARAVVLALAQAKAESVIVLNRTTERSASLVSDLADSFPKNALTFEALTRESLAVLGKDIDLFINTTSVGMSPNVGACPWPADIPMPSKATFYDMVYNPLETVFLTRARAAGGTTIDGLNMLVHQGAAAFERWTGRPAPIEVMRQACLNQLRMS